METTSEHIEKLQEAMARTRASASSEGGAVSVEVGADGTLYSIRFGPGAGTLSQREFADAVIELHNDALGDAIEILNSIAEELTAGGELSADIEEFENRAPTEGNAPVESNAPVEGSVPGEGRTPVDRHSAFEESTAARAHVPVEDERSAPEVTSHAVGSAPEPDSAAMPVESGPLFPFSHVIGPAEEPDDESRYAVVFDDPRPRRRDLPINRDATGTHGNPHTGYPEQQWPSRAPEQSRPEGQASAAFVPMPAWLDSADLDSDATAHGTEDFDLLRDPLWDN